ncbi:uncharacterized protein Obp19c [Drosophila montana]|uniref:uncharacterized protein Obp19c n=1 Tax=Drosophila montana TaxID=40370 RepID=UPI00313BE696
MSDKMMIYNTLLLLLALAGCSWMQCVRAQSQTPGFDLSRLFGARSNEPLSKLIDRNLPEVQEIIDRTKNRCLKQLQMSASQRSLIREPRPTEQEKCLVACVLKGIQIMDSSSNKLNLRRVQELTSQVTDNNKLAVTLSCSLAQSCNRAVSTQEPCEAAHQLNQCIGRQMLRNGVKLSW